MVVLKVARKDYGTTTMAQGGTIIIIIIIIIIATTTTTTTIESSGGSLTNPCQYSQVGRMSIEPPGK
jgi:hypothetical protein